MTSPTFLRKLTAKVGEPTTFEVVPAEQSVALSGGFDFALCDPTW